MSKVLSANLASASPVRRVMVYGSVCTQDHGGVREGMMYVDGDYAALNTLFSIVHYQFNRIPDTLSLDELYEIALVVSQYKCTHLIYPWADKWMKGLSEYRITAPYNLCHKALFVAWTLGDSELFCNMADALIVSTEVNELGELVDVDGMELRSMALPEGFIGKYLQSPTTTT